MLAGGCFYGMSLRLKGMGEEFCISKCISFSLYNTLLISIHLIENILIQSKTAVKSPPPTSGVQPGYVPDIRIRLPQSFHNVFLGCPVGQVWQ